MFNLKFSYSSLMLAEGFLALADGSIDIMIPHLWVVVLVKSPYLTMTRILNEDGNGFNNMQ